MKINYSFCCAITKDISDNEFVINESNPKKYY